MFEERLLVKKRAMMAEGVEAELTVIGSQPAEADAFE